MEPLETIREWFWSVVEIRGPDDCWEWTKYRMGNGRWYGMFQRRKISTMPLTSHTTAWKLTHGEIPPGKHILHTCDNPGCCNPKHLFLGTQTMNVLDRTVKGRTASGNANGARTMPERNPFVANGGSGLHGEKHPNAILTAEEVKAIREYPTNWWGAKSFLAEKYGVSATTIGRILAGKQRGGG